MKMIPIPPKADGSPGSKQIVAIGYDLTRCRMRVEFTGGAMYDYDSVLPEQVCGVLFAPSTGAAFNEIIKKGGNPYTKLTPEELERQAQAAAV